MKSRFAAHKRTSAINCRFSLQDRKTLPCHAPRGGLLSLGVVFGFVETAVKPSALVHMA